MNGRLHVFWFFPYLHLAHESVYKFFISKTKWITNKNSIHGICNCVLWDGDLFWEFDNMKHTVHVYCWLLPVLLMVFLHTSETLFHRPPLPNSYLLFRHLLECHFFWETLDPSPDHTSPLPSSLILSWEWLLYCSSIASCNFESVSLSHHFTFVVIHYQLRSVFPTVDTLYPVLGGSSNYIFNFIE